jgi:hypothetical protein
MIFPHIQELTMSNLDQMRATQCIHRRTERTGAVELREKAHARREKMLHRRMRARCAPVGWNNRAPVAKNREEKSGWISPNLLVN